MVSGGGTAFGGPADATTRGGAGLGAGDWVICCLCEQLTDDDQRRNRRDHEWTTEHGCLLSTALGSNCDAAAR